MEEEMDPDYKFFLDHLRPRGYSYVLHVNGSDHHHPIHINYEEEEEEEQDDCDESKKNEEPEADGPVDEQVGAFLHHLRRTRDGSLVLELENGVVVRYGESKQNPPQQQEQDEGSVIADHGRSRRQVISCTSSSTPRIRNRNHALQSSSGSRNRSPPPKPTRCSSEFSAAKDSAFTMRLRKVLDRPFNQGEYERLVRLAKASKPVVKFKHLRGDDIPYESETMGNSYFDYYPDLARMVKHADRYKGLNLLRGLFFWLQNIEHEGSYRPWVPKPS